MKTFIFSFSGGEYHNPKFGLATKTKAWKGAGRKWNPKITFTLPKV